MQHRVMVGDDAKGLFEPMNETDADGLGIRVTAKYYMQIFDTQKGASLQRKRQLSTQTPLQYFFIFNYGQDDHEKIETAAKTTSSMTVN